MSIPKKHPHVERAGIYRIGEVDHGELTHFPNEDDSGIDLFWRGEGEPKFDTYFLHVLECMDRFYEVTMPHRKQPYIRNWKYIGTVAVGLYFVTEFALYNPRHQDSRLVWRDRKIENEEVVSDDPEQYEPKYE